MSENQGDLLGVDPEADLRRMLAEGEIPESKWAPLLADLLRVFEAKHKRDGVEAAEAFVRASETVLTLAEYFGGRVVYLPKNDRLKVALRDAEIWRLFSGRNVPDLSRQFDLTEIHVYQILRVQRALHTRRLQGRLFPE